MVRFSEIKDVIICPRGVETPIAHVIAIKGHLLNIAYELDSIVLLGAPLLDTEYRPLNIDIRVARFLMDKPKSLNIDKNFNEEVQHHESKIGKKREEVKSKTLFDRALAKLHKRMNKQGVLTVQSTTISNVAYDGLDYFLLYYLICKYKPMDIDLANNFEFVSDAFIALDAILSSVKLSAVDLKAFVDFSLTYENVLYPVGSKIRSISRFEILNSADLTQSMWRTMYINRIIRNIPTSLRHTSFLPALDWGYVRCGTKHFFSSQELKSQATFGDSMDFINATALRQMRAIEDLDVATDAIKEVHDVASRLKETVGELNYTLGDLAFVSFFEDVGVTMYDELKRTIESSDETLLSLVFTDHEQVKLMVLQYLYEMLLLTQNGIIHNDARLTNILLTPVEPSEQREKRINPLPSGNKTLDMGLPIVHLTIIDFNNAILSHHHHDFAHALTGIKKELVVALKSEGKELSKNHGIVFNCYAMYDVIKFCLLIRMHMDSVNAESHRQKRPIAIPKRNREWLDKIIKAATEILQQAFGLSTDQSLPFNTSDTHGSMQWLIETIFAPQVKSGTTHPTRTVHTPEFISARRKYADTHKRRYVAEYASNLR